jgi:hypothetical protein
MYFMYPKGHIMSWDDDVNEAFPQLVFHRDAASNKTKHYEFRAVLLAIG